MDPLSLALSLLVGALVTDRSNRRTGPWAYHLTYRSDLASIARHGLVPQMDTERAWGCESGIWFVNLLGHEAGAPADSETSAWIRFPWPGDVPCPGDVSEPGEYRSRRSVSPEEIEVHVDVRKIPLAHPSDEGRWVPVRDLRGRIVRR